MHNVCVASGLTSGRVPVRMMIKCALCLTSEPAYIKPSSVNDGVCFHTMAQLFRSLLHEDILSRGEVNLYLNVYLPNSNTKYTTYQC